MSTDASGVYKFGSLTHGSYKIYMHNNQGYLDEWYDNLIHQGNWDGYYVSTTWLGLHQAAWVNSSTAGTLLLLDPDAE